MTAERFAISFGRWKPLLLACGLTPSRSYVEVGADLVQVRMGWGFSGDIPRSSIRSATRVDQKSISIGVHGWRGRWLVNGAAAPLVTIAIDPPAPARTTGFPLTLRELTVSTDEPDRLVAALSR